MHALRKLIRAIARWVARPSSPTSATALKGSAGFEDFFGSKGGHGDH